MEKMYELVTSPAEKMISVVFKEARNDIFIASPYVKDYGAQVILNNANVKHVRLLTNLDISNVTSHGFDLNAILKLWDKFEFSVSSLGKLHAKVYIADKRIACITSANLTCGGLRENYEYGVLIRDISLVSEILSDMEKYFSLGNIFGLTTIKSILKDVEEIKSIREKLEDSLETKQLQKMLKRKEDYLQTKILQNRVQGQTINAIFVNTIIYLLSTRGALSTEEMHPLIQNIHPDICDDSIDRVIQGQHFGKKWKHYVRNAQQSLKQNKKVDLRDGKWCLRNKGGVA